MKKIIFFGALALWSLQSMGQRVCLEGCEDGDRVSLTFNPRVAQQMFDSLFFRLDSLTAYIQACGCAGTDSGGTSGGGSSTPGSASISCVDSVLFDNHYYSTVLINDQCWFAENLRTTAFANGDPIPERSSDGDWSGTSEGARCAYGGSPDNLAQYGYLYNGLAMIDSAGLCPVGWHVPTDGEWTAMTNYLGGDSASGLKLKSVAPAWSGTDSSGFSALPGGWRNELGWFMDVDFSGYYWTSTLDGSSALCRFLYTDYDYITPFTYPLKIGLSVRCIQDSTATTASAPDASTGAVTDLAETTVTLNGSVDSDGGDTVTAAGFKWGTAANLSGASDATGSGTSGSFTASLTGLTGNTTYYFSAYATNGEGTAYGDTLSFTTLPAASSFSCGGTVAFDDYTYRTVQIGAQCWFAENLRTTVYVDGSPIPEVTGDYAWSELLDTGGRSAYDNDSAQANMGFLYNWNAIGRGPGLCPIGWEVPSDTEWDLLASSLGAQAGLAMKAEPGDSIPWNGINSSGFTGLPAGLRDYDGLFMERLSYGNWWTSLEFDSTAESRYVSNGSDDVFVGDLDKRTGLSVRCMLTP